jgi:hypothetical protein
MVMVLAPDKRAKQSAAARSARGDDDMAPAPVAEEGTVQGAATAEATTAPEAVPVQADAGVPAEGEG